MSVLCVCVCVCVSEQLAFRIGVLMSETALDHGPLDYCRGDLCKQTFLLTL